MFIHQKLKFYPSNNLIRMSVSAMTRDAISRSGLLRRWNARESPGILLKLVLNEQVRAEPPTPHSQQVIRSEMLLPHGPHFSSNQSVHGRMRSTSILQMTAPATTLQLQSRVCHLPSRTVCSPFPNDSDQTGMVTSHPPDRVAAPWTMFS